MAEGPGGWLKGQDGGWQARVGRTSRAERRGPERARGRMRRERNEEGDKEEEGNWGKYRRRSGNTGRGMGSKGKGNVGRIMERGGERKEI